MLNPSRTIFALNPDYRGIVEMLENDAMGAHVNISGPRNGWHRITLFYPAARMTLTSLESVAPGDSFSTVLQSTVSLLKKSDAAAGVLERVAASPFIISVVAEPAVPHAVHSTVIPALARMVDGLIFDGSTLKDAAGDTLAAL